MSQATAQPLWTPSPERIRQSVLTDFLKYLNTRHHPDSAITAASLHAWSIHNLDHFWSAVWDFCAVIGERSATALEWNQPDIRTGRFFPDAKLNFAENILKCCWQVTRRDAANPNHRFVRTGSDDAIVFWAEDKVRRRLSYDQLYHQVQCVAHYFKKCGITQGDRIAGLVANTPETIIAMLAATSIGAIWSSCSPDFGADGVIDRFGQITPKLLCAHDSVYYNGKTLDQTAKITQTCASISSIKHVLKLPYDFALAAPPLNLTATVTKYQDIIISDPPALTFTRFDYDQPVFIMYSSGTTGVPKCITHRAGGVLIEHFKEHQLHTDIQPGDRVFYYTTCGWMMWNWLATALGSGATLLLYDGSPLYPNSTILFEYAAAEHMTLFGTSAKFIDLLRKDEINIQDNFDLRALKTIASTASPLAPESFEYIYRQVKADVNLASISGGTDIVGCFALGNSNLPVWPGELQTPSFGIDIGVYDNQGKPLPPGEKGELVCRTPFPSMPINFWGDLDGHKYTQAYFDKFPHVWYHGDYIEITEHGGIIIHGRSDSTLKPGGVRIGTAEIYRQVQDIEEVLESVVVGQNWDNDIRVILFVKLRDNLMLDQALIDKIKKHIRAKASPRHVPAKVIQVRDIPRTKNGKIVELAVKAVIHNQTVDNQQAIANPEALQYYRNLPELQS